jgi:hypothetical protein
MTYEELNATMPGTLFRVKGGAYNYMFLQGVCPHDRTIRVEMNGVAQNVDPSQVNSLTVYDTAMIKRMYEAVFPDEDTRFNQVVEFIEKLK